MSATAEPAEVPELTARPDPVAPRTPAEAVALLSDRRATGALHGPLGSLYLVDGLVTAAESPRAPGLADLLTGCGRTTPGDWTELLRLHGPQGRVGEALVDRRLLTRGELELGHLGTLFDAAYFVLADRAGGTWRYEPDARHWLGAVAAVDPARLRREAERRRRLLDRIWPWPQLDTEPVRPVEHNRRPSHRPPGRRRRELLDHADGRRTPADLARLLGRSGFGVTADVRR
ncbi:transcriptional regulator, partial [Streptomyces sp. FH025]|uniref:transcriptional regulator n=1 Tax=Streptomyces sp. FH025 TaxID=2815937 RepID=UPI001A9F80C1